MLRPWKIGSAFGIGVYVHWTFLLLPLFVLLNPGDGGLSPAFYLLLVLAVFGCVVLHEFGHALTARLFGINTHDITIYPIGGVARLERMSEKPWEEFWISVAGPAVNVVIAAVLFLVAVAVWILKPDLLGFGQPIESFKDFPLGTQFLICLLMSNVLLVFFNMLPAYPMDGGRVLRALLSAFVGHLQATRIAVAVAAVVALLMAVLGPYLLGQWLLPVVAVFIFLVGQRELYALEMRERARQQHEEEEPLEVLPVHRPQPQLDLQPTILVYAWDPRNGVWVREPVRRPVPIHYGDLP